MDNSTHISFEEKIKNKIKEVEKSRELVLLLEKQAEDNSLDELSLNAQACYLLNLSSDLQWVLKIYKEDQDSKLFPNCLDLIEPEANADHRINFGGC